MNHNNLWARISLFSAYWPSPKEVWTLLSLMVTSYCSACNRTFWKNTHPLKSVLSVGIDIGVTLVVVGGPCGLHAPVCSLSDHMLLSLMETLTVSHPAICCLLSFLTPQRWHSQLPPKLGCYSNRNCPFYCLWNEQAKKMCYECVSLKEMSATLFYAKIFNKVISVQDIKLV